MFQLNSTFYEDKKYHLQFEASNWKLHIHWIPEKIVIHHDSENVKLNRFLNLNIFLLLQQVTQPQDFLSEH